MRGSHTDGRKSGTPVRTGLIAASLIGTPSHTRTSVVARGRTAVETPNPKLPEFLHQIDLNERIATVIADGARYMHLPSCHRRQGCLGDHSAPQESLKMEADDRPSAKRDAEGGEAPSVVHSGGDVVIIITGATSSYEEGAENDLRIVFPPIG